MVHIWISSESSLCPVAGPDWSSPSAFTAPRGRHYGPVGGVFESFDREKGVDDLALGHLQPLLLHVWGSDRSHHGGDLPGRLTTQWGEQRRAFTSTISRPRPLCDEPNIPSATIPKLTFFSFFAGPLPVTVLSVYGWSFKVELLVLPLNF